MIAPPFHVGIVTPDVDATMHTLSRSTGATWSTVRGEKHVVWTESGVVEIAFRGAYSTEHEMRLEVIESVPDTLWSAGSGADELHHVGYWSTDLRADSARLVADGCPVVAAGGGDPASPAHFVYHRHGAGGYLELLDVAARPAMQAWWAGLPDSSEASLGEA